MRKFLFLIPFVLGQVFSLAQSSREIMYHYDENGNRVTREVVNLRTAQNPGDPSENIQDLDAFDEEDGIEAMIDDARFTVYPNPTTSVVRTEWQMEDGDHVPIKEARLIGLNGNVVRALSKPSLPLDMDMQALPNGTYILWIMPVEGEIQRVKVVKQ